MIVALDVPSLDEAKRLVESLGEACRFYKIGPRLFYRAGPGVVEWLRQSEKLVFLDLKAHDIPSVVESAARAAKEMGATFFTAHVANGAAAAAVSAAGDQDEGFYVLGVTVLTSSDASTVSADCPGTSVEELLALRARSALDAGCHGIVLAAPDLPVVNEILPTEMLKVCPGIRTERTSSSAPEKERTSPDDQSRTATPEEAAALGADFIVVGRPVIESSDPLGAFSSIAESFRA